jgi:serine/threonine protein kinase
MFSSIETKLDNISDPIIIFSHKKELKVVSRQNLSEKNRTLAQYVSHKQVQCFSYTVFIEQKDYRGCFIIPIGIDNEYEFYKNKLSLNDVPLSPLRNNIGQGAYGKVHCFGDQSIAVKEMPYHEFDFIKDIPSLSLLSFVYKKLSFSPSCESVLPYYGTFYGTNSVYILTKLFSTNMHDFIKYKHDNETITKVIYNILKSLLFARICGLIHLDIKPQNILVNPIDSTSCIADWGLSVWKPMIKQFDFNVQTITYRCPEIIVHEPYSFSADVWGCGLTLREFFYPPVYLSHDSQAGEKINKLYNVKNPLEVLKTNYSPIIYKSKIPEQYREIILEMLNSVPRKRPELEKLLNLEIFSELRKQENLSPIIFRNEKFISPSFSEQLSLYPLYNYKKDLYISNQDRYIVLEWLIEICDDFFYSFETLFMTILTFDEFMRHKRTSHKEYQTYAVACLYICVRLFGTCIPEISRLSHMTDGASPVNKINEAIGYVMRILDSIYKLNMYIIVDSTDSNRNLIIKEAILGYLYEPDNYHPFETSLFLLGRNSFLTERFNKYKNNKIYCSKIELFLNIKK